MYTFKQNLVSKDKYYCKCPYSMLVEYITIHDTQNNAPAKNEIAYMINNNNYVSYHLCVDEKECIQGLPFNRNGFHAGDGQGKGNRCSIGIEIARATHKDKSLYYEAEENAVYVVARLLYKFGLGVEDLRRHKDWSGKNCPKIINDEDRWNGFKGRVDWVLKEIKAGRCDARLESGTTYSNNN